MERQSQILTTPKSANMFKAFLERQRYFVVHHFKMQISQVDCSKYNLHIKHSNHRLMQVKTMQSSICVFLWVQKNKNFFPRRSYCGFSRIIQIVMESKCFINSCIIKVCKYCTQRLATHQLDYLILHYIEGFLQI